MMNQFNSPIRILLRKFFFFIVWTTVFTLVSFSSVHASSGSFARAENTTESVRTSGTSLAVTSPSLSSADRPVIFVSPEEIDEIKEHIRAGKQPWSGAYTSLIKRADAALNMAPRSVVDNDGPWAANYDRHSYGEDATYISDGIVNPSANKGDSNAYYAMGGAVLDLAIAYAFTGDDRYARKAIDLIYHWCLNPSTFMRPVARNFSPHTRGSSSHGSIAVYAATTFLVFGSSFVLDHSYWEETGRGAREQYLKWVSEMYQSAVELGESNLNNIYTHYLEMRVVLAALWGDRTELETIFNLWKTHIATSIKPNGRLHRDARRTRGIDYSMYGLEPFVKVAFLAKQYGVDLWNWEDQYGKPIRRAYDYMLPYVLDQEIPAAWLEDGNSQITEVNLEQVGRVFMMAYSAYGDEKYLEAAAMGSGKDWCTLLFSTRSFSGSDVDPPDPGDEDDTGGTENGPPDDYPEEENEANQPDEETKPVEGGELISFNAVAEVAVYEGMYLGDKSGVTSLMRVKSGATGTSREVYLKFDISTVPSSFTRATIQLYTLSVGNVGHVNEAALVPDNSWYASTITWDNKPASTTVLARWMPVGGQTVTIDVTEAVKVLRKTTNKLSVRIYAPVEGDGQDWVYYSSGRQGGNGSVLLIQTEDKSTTRAELDEISAGLPASFHLSQNYPNPFNPATTIRYQLSQHVPVRLVIYSIDGQLIKTLVHETQQPGTYEVAWNGRNQAGMPVASGVYMYHLVAGTFQQKRAMVLLR